MIGIIVIVAIAVLVQIAEAAARTAGDIVRDAVPAAVVQPDLRVLEDAPVPPAQWVL